MEGIIGIKPEVKRLSFKPRGNLDVHFVDGRTVIVPLSYVLKLGVVCDYVTAIAVLRTAQIGDLQTLGRS